MTEMTETIELKVGDELAFLGNYGTRWRILPISKITPSGRMHCGDYVLNPDLSVRGVSGHSGPFCGVVPDDRIRKKCRRQDTLEAIRGVDWSKMSTINLRSVLLIVGWDESSRKSNAE
jgi:hypothetical protein